MPFELSDQSKIKIDSADLSLVSRGTDVVVRGMVMPGRPAQAYEVTVKLPEPPAGNDRPAAKQPPKKAGDSGLPGPATDK